MAEKDKPIIIESTMERWNDVISFNQLFLSNFIFRGQADYSWSLSSSLERMVNNNHPKYVDKHLPYIYEKGMLEEFKFKYPLYAKNVNPGKDENLEWLTLMQHYGAPTRLIDFTKSLFVALFMAIDGSFCENSVVWAVNKHLLIGNFIKEYCIENNVSSATGKLEPYIYGKANKYIGIIPPLDIEKAIIPINPHLCNERIVIQQGTFLMSTDISVPFMNTFYSFLGIQDKVTQIPIRDLLDYSYSLAKTSSRCSIALFKIVIPKTFKWQITTLLRQMNITAETLYPGLEGMAKSLSALRQRTGYNY